MLVWKDEGTYSSRSSAADFLEDLRGNRGKEEDILKHMFLNNQATKTYDKYVITTHRMFKDSIISSV